jgi:pycsar effector protein
MEPLPPRTFAPNAVNMIRNAQAIHVRLSAMADQKASILMGASFVIFTITINQSHDALPPLPLLVLGSFAFVSAVLTVLAIIPKTRMPAGAPVNLLFFGSFTQLSQDEFVDRVVEAMADEETMLRTVAADLYGNGLVLQRKKYRRLEWAYRVFLTGLAASAIVFAVRFF